ncbi:MULTISPECIES: hypothetical protein [unclassified Microcystis]|nr:hypothetical protein [Microcystis sp. LE17-20D]MCZ8065298.1 hypothetical protein [Microcystis sp. LE17-20D]MCZ8159187.1 hypothetical protein [Microcystis sp. LE19-196.1B]MCZ8275546.1 hypothetical protein [Microcystis sp. LE19-4.1E]
MISSVLSGSSGTTETVRDSKETGQINPIERLNNHLFSVVLGVLQKP